MWSLCRPSPQIADDGLTIKAELHKICIPFRAWSPHLSAFNKAMDWRINIDIALNVIHYDREPVNFPSQH